VANARRRMREAVIEAKIGVQAMREALARTTAEAERERRHLADAERRGHLAEDIGDDETAAIARRFASRHAERVTVLERKLAVQADELALAERELAEMTAQLKGASGAEGARPASSGAASQLEEELLKSELDRVERQIDVDAQLDELKKRMGR